MAEVDLAACMEAVAARVRDSTDFDTPGPEAVLERAYGWPTSSVNPPCFIVGYPETLDFDATMGRGADRLTLPCWAIFGAANLRTSRDVASSFIQGLKAALDGAEPTVWQSARARGITFEIAPLGADETLYVQLNFDVDIIT